MPKVFLLPVYRSPAGANGYGTPSLASCSFIKTDRSLPRAAETCTSSEICSPAVVCCTDRTLKRAKGTKEVVHIWLSTPGS